MESELLPWQDDVQEFYRNKGMGAALGTGQSPAVLVVDMTKSFTDPSTQVGTVADSGVSAIGTLLDAARQSGVPIAYTVLAFPVVNGKVDCGTWGKKLPALATLREDDPASTEVDERIKPQSGDVVLRKACPSAFFGTTLLSALVPLRIDTVIVTGCATSGCVRATVVDAISYGYRVVVPKECVVDRALGPHKANLLDISAKYGDVLSVHDVVSALPKGAGANDR